MIGMDLLRGNFSLTHCDVERVERIHGPMEGFGQMEGDSIADRLFQVWRERVDPVRVFRRASSRQRMLRP